MNVMTTRPQRTPNAGRSQENSKRLIVLNSASAAVYRLIDVFLLVWLHQYLLRRITPEEYSLYPIVMSVVLFIPILSSILSSGVGRYIVEAYARRDDLRITQIVSSMFPPLLGLGCLVMAVGLFLAWRVDSLLKVEPGLVWDARVMMVLLMFSTAIRPAMVVFTVGLYVRQRFVAQNGIRLIKEVVRLTVLVTLLLGVSTRVLWVAVSTVVAEVFDVAVQMVISRRMLPALRFRRTEFRWGMVGTLISFGGWNFIASMANQVRHSLTTILLNRMGTAADVTSFYLGGMAERQMQSWITALGIPVSPVVTSLRAVGAEDRLMRLYLRGTRFSLWALLAVAVPGALYAEEVIRLYVGSEFMDAAAVMTITLATALIGHVGWLVYQYAQAGAQVRSLAWRTCLTQGLALAAVAYALGVLHLGAVGAAMAGFVVGTTGCVVLTWSWGLKLAGLTFSQWSRESLLPGLIPGIVGAVAWALMKKAVAPSTWLTLGVCVAVGAVCYMAVLLVFCLAPQDRADLKSVLAKLRSRVAGRAVNGTKVRG